MAGGIAAYLSRIDSVCEPFSIQALLRGRRSTGSAMKRLDEDEPFSLMTSEAWEAAARAQATHEQLVAEGHGAGGSRAVAAAHLDLEAGRWGTGQGADLVGQDDRALRDAG